MSSRSHHTTDIGRMDRLERRMLLSGTDAAWSRYVSGNGTDDGRDVAIDPDGNVLLTGITTGSGLHGAINSPGGGDNDAFVSKLGSDGTLLWSMYLGGSGSDGPGAIATDGAGNIYVTGGTNSPNFPGAINAPSENGSAFVAKISPAGAVLWSRHLGGTGSEGGSGIAIDAAENLLIAGSTSSIDFPGALNDPFGGSDIFVAKLLPTGGLTWARYLGGGGNDTAADLALDPAGAAYVTGDTVSTNFLNANNAYPANHQNAAYVARVTPEGLPSWSTYLNLFAPGVGAKRTRGNGLALDASGDMYVCGSRAIGAGGVGTPYVAKVESGGTQDWVASLAAGSPGDPESATDLISDADGNTLVVGQTRNGVQLPAAVNFPSTGYDTWVAKLNPVGTVVWSKYVGGSDEEQSSGIASDDAGSAVICGWTRSTNFPDALNTFTGNTDAFVARVPIVPVAPAVLSAAFDVNVGPHRLVVRFTQDISQTLTADDLILTNLTTGQTIPSSSISVTFNLFERSATFTFPGLSGGLLPDGRLRATLPADSVMNAGGVPMEQDFVFEFRFLRGDATLDGLVNLSDFNILASNFGLANRVFTQGDFNYDGRTNLLDFNLLAARFGQSVAPVDSRATRVGEGDEDDAVQDLLD